MRVFFDTNVLASALMSHGLCRDLLDRVLIGHDILLVEPVRQELHRVLTDKFKVPDNLWRELETQIDGFEQVSGAYMPLSSPIPDRDDIPILACALASKAEIFVTGDKALLALGTVEGMPIVSPRELWLRLTNPG